MSTPAAPVRSPLVGAVLMTAAVLVGGLLLRVFVLRSSWGVLNADEAYSGLQSVGVIRDGRFPIVIDGNVYSAALEAYLFSPVLVFAGGSIAVLKWLFVGIWVVASLATFGAARRLMNARNGAISAMLVWLAPGALLVLSSRAYMGYALGLSVATAAVWAVAIVADQPTAVVRSSALVGFLAGLALYIHPMWVALLVPVLAVAAVVHRRDWLRWWLPLAAGGIAANAPFLLWNASNGWPSLTSQVFPPGTYSERLQAFVTGLLPRAFGLRTFDGQWVFGRPLGLLIYAAMAFGVIAGCVVMVRASRRPSRWIVPAGLAVVFPVMALFPHMIFVDDGRYAIISFPLIVLALGAALSELCTRLAPTHAALGFAAVTALWVGVTFVPFAHQQQGFQRADANAWQQLVIHRLDEVGISLVAGNYGLVLPIEFRSDQAIRVAIAGNPYVIRFPTSQRLVQGSPPDEVAFLFPPGDQDPGWFYLPLAEYRVEQFGGIVLYLPPAAKG